MLITSPFTLANAPQQQAAGAAPQVGSDPSAGQFQYTISQRPSTVTTEDTAPTVTIGQLSQPLPEGARIGIRSTAKATAGAIDAITFSGLVVRLEPFASIGGAMHLMASVEDTRRIVTSRGEFLLLHETNIAAGEAIMVILPVAEQPTIEWSITSNVLVCAWPTPALRARLRRPRTTVTSITGREWVTTRTFDPVLERLRVPLNNEYRTALPHELAQLDSFAQFAVWPAGIERIFRDTPDVIEHRRHDFVRICAIESWTGWRGHSDIDIHGATGEMNFAEVAWPTRTSLVIQPVITRRPSLPELAAPPPAAPVTPPPRSQETAAEWDSGVRTDWAPDTPVGWENP